MHAGTLADSRALVEALEAHGFTVVLLDGALRGPQGEADVLVLDVERVTPEAMAALRRRAYVVALMGWWDEREAEYREAADFVLNAPVRGWQVGEMAEDFRAGRRIMQVA